MKTMATALREPADRRSGQGRGRGRLLRVLVAAATVSVGLPILTVTLAARVAGASEAAAVIKPVTPPTVTTGAISAVSCSAATTCTAVGSFVTLSEHQITFAERWDGVQWTPETSYDGKGSSNNQLNGVSCPSATDCIAVGSFLSFATGRSMTLAERWDGANWSVQQTPTVTGSTYGFLNGVSCTSTTACTAVGGDSEGTLAEQWNGTSWSVQASPNPAGGQNSQLSGVSCTSATACTSVGTSHNSGALAERWDGTNWSIQTTPSPALRRLNGVSCASATACTAVGSDGGKNLAEQWNGSSWSVQTTPNPSGTTGPFNGLNGVSCTSASSCTAVGGGPAPGHSPSVTLAEYWDGTSWSIQSTPSLPSEAMSELNGVSCTSPTACVAVGVPPTSASAGNTEVTLAEYWDGVSWTVQTTYGEFGAADSQLNGVSCTSTADCTAVGFYNPTAASATTLAEQWNGTSWTPESAPSTPGGELFGVACPSPTACIAVGSAGASTLAERWNGTHWTIQTTPNPKGAQYSDLFGVSCVSPSDCIAVGSFFVPQNPPTSPGTFALAEHWDGTGWTIQKTPGGGALDSVSCTSATACSAVGSSFGSSGDVALAERWDGTTWTVESTPDAAGGILNSVWCVSATSCTAVGNRQLQNNSDVTLAEHWNGATWTVQSTPSPSGNGELRGVTCLSTTNCTAVGSFFNARGFSLTEHWDGTHWSLQLTPEPSGAIFSELNGVSRASTAVLFAVGFSDTAILRIAGVPVATTALPLAVKYL